MQGFCAAAREDNPMERENSQYSDEEHTCSLVSSLSSDMSSRRARTVLAQFVGYGASPGKETSNVYRS